MRIESASSDDAERSVGGAGGGERTVTQQSPKAKFLFLS